MRMAQHTIPYTLPFSDDSFPPSPTSAKYFEDVGLQRWYSKAVSHKKKDSNNLLKDTFSIYLVTGLIHQYLFVTVVLCQLIHTFHFQT